MQNKIKMKMLILILTITIALSCKNNYKNQSDTIDAKEYRIAPGKYIQGKHSLTIPKSDLIFINKTKVK